jgi:two-component system CheB/CheR fusion protein
LGPDEKSWRAGSQVDHLQLFTGVIRDASQRKELQTQVLEIASEEQRRIGQELHDGTQQELTGLTLLAGSLSALLKSILPADVSGTKQWIVDAAGIAGLRKNTELLSQRLSEIDALGLRSALQELAASTDGQSGVSCHFESAGNVQVSSNLTATHLFRIAQEAVTNALRHGQADRIDIRLEGDAHQVDLEVSDNGTGFDLSEFRSRLDGAKSHHWGLKIMEYRANLIGGRLSITRNDAGGVIVLCKVPLAGASSNG